MSYTRITGTNAFGQSIEKFYKGSPKEAEKLFLSSPPDKGGATSWSTEEIKELPDYVYINCPHCKEKFLNTNLITEV
tara:strand:- start:458 stop:688 length:231 start_codon:yes stop_codon:yes gene_type:complete